MAELLLSDNMTITSIDDLDLARVLALSISWRLNKGYVATKDNGKEVRLHRFITDCPDGLGVDHLDGNKLNNRRDNLEVVAHAENMKRMWEKRKARKVKVGLFDYRKCCDLYQE